MKAIPVLAIAALLLTGCGAAAEAQKGQTVTSEPIDIVSTPTPSKPPVHKVGEAVEFKDRDGSTARVTILSSHYAPGGQAKNGGTLTTEILWETTAGVTSPSVMSFDTDDATGGPVTLSLSSTFGTGPVLEGKSRRGTIIDDVGPGPWVIRYGALTGPQIFWEVS